MGFSVAFAIHQILLYRNEMPAPGIHYVHSRSRFPRLLRRCNLYEKQRFSRNLSQVKTISTFNLDFLRRSCFFLRSVFKRRKTKKDTFLRIFNVCQMFASRFSLLLNSKDETQREGNARYLNGFLAAESALGGPLSAAGCSLFSRRILNDHKFTWSRDAGFLSVCLRSRESIVFRSDAEVKTKQLCRSKRFPRSKP